MRVLKIVVSIIVGIAFSLLFIIGFLSIQGMELSRDGVRAVLKPQLRMITKETYENEFYPDKEITEELKVLDKSIEKVGCVGILVDNVVYKIPVYKDNVISSFFDSIIDIDGEFSITSIKDNYKDKVATKDEITRLDLGKKDSKILVVRFKGFKNNLIIKCNTDEALSFYSKLHWSEYELIKLKHGILRISDNQFRDYTNKFKDKISKTPLLTEDEREFVFSIKKVKTDTWELLKEGVSYSMLGDMESILGKFLYTLKNTGYSINSIGKMKYFYYIRSDNFTVMLERRNINQVDIKVFFKCIKEKNNEK